MFFKCFFPSQKQLADAEARANEGGSFDVALWEAFSKADPTNRAKLAYMYHWLRPFDTNDDVHFSHTYDPIWTESVERHGKRVYYVVKASQADIIRDAVKEYEETHLTSFAEWFSFIGNLIHTHDARIIDIINV
jgi:hypothetical protein